MFTVTLQSCKDKLGSKIEELESRLDDLNANKKKRMDKEVRLTTNIADFCIYFIKFVLDFFQF